MQLGEWLVELLQDSSKHFVLCTVSENHYTIQVKITFETVISPAWSTEIFQHLQVAGKHNMKNDCTRQILLALTHIERICNLIL
jgi:hypothetical protein